MRENQDIKKSIEWMNRRLETSDFYKIFNVPNKGKKKIREAIEFLKQLNDRYASFLNSIKEKPDKGRTEKFLALLFADIFSELAISVKLAGEGYIKYSLREIRATLDLIFMGIFTISSWPGGSAESDEDINPMANAILSGYWGKMSIFKNFDRLALPHVGVNNRSEERSMKETMHKLSKKFYEEIIYELPHNKALASNKKAKEIFKKILEEFVVELIREDNKVVREILKNYLSPESFHFLLMSDDNITLRACDKHEYVLLKDLKRKLRIQGKLTSKLKEKLRLLTFHTPDAKTYLGNEFGRCKYCENEATIYAVYSRPDTPEMKKLIKYQLQKDKLNAINLCVKKYFELKNKKIKDKYFGDLIYSEIYTKLNDYVHANIVEEPTVSDWFNNFYIPTVKVLDCILSSISTM